MRHILKNLLRSITIASLLAGFLAPMFARAQNYPIDCAILLCLSDGWPASIPCNRARVEFIRRITPWPIEPPLQIWRCPMGATYEAVPATNSANHIIEALLRSRNVRIGQSLPSYDAFDPVEVVAWPRNTPGSIVSVSRPYQLVQDFADIDISGPEFSFVRSIRVFDVRYARQTDSGLYGSCRRSATVSLGTYGAQGEFTWRNSFIDALPISHVGLERWGENCPNIHHRSVFVDWRDLKGNYGFEQVNY